MPSIPAGTGAAKANIPVGSMPASTGYTVKAGDNLSKILTGKGMAATPANIAKIAKLSGIKDPNMIKPGQTIKFN
jgi:nucleoid-associated protein YgaU